MVIEVSSALSVPAASSVTFQLADAAGTPQVNLCVGNPLDAAGKTSCNFNAPGNGSYTIRVNYSGDTPTAAATP